VEVEFGCVQQYNLTRGFGFVSRTFKDLHQHKKGVWFHITKIKYDYPDLAQKLDAGLYKNISFWYEIDNKDGEKVSKVWLDIDDIPAEQRKDLVIELEQIWRTTTISISPWLDKITLTLVGEFRKDELSRERNDEIYRLKEVEKQKKIYEVPTPEQLFEFPTGKELKRVYVGLPEHLAHFVLWVDPKYRPNPLSHIPGGSDVIVEYQDGRVFGYDWVKIPSAYVKSFFGEIVEYGSNEFRELNEKSQLQIAKQKLARVYARQYRNEDEYLTATFTEVWSSETSNEMPWKALQNFEYRQRNQRDLEDF